MKRFIITGASGFVGQYIASRLLDAGHRVTGTGTSQGISRFSDLDDFSWVRADTTQPGAWQEEVKHADVVINLTGRNIFSYWTKAYKKAIYDSRILTTRHVVEAIEPGSVLLNTSAAGFYGDGKDQLLTEESQNGTDFLATVCRDWEQEAYQAAEKQVRVAMMRFGVVLGSGGALGKMLPAFKLMAGGPLGSGVQWFPWIHIEDLYRAALHLVDQQDLTGAFNFTAPGVTRQKNFARALGKAVHRPAFMPAPGFAVKLIMGEMGSAFLNSQRAVPKRLQESGFDFKFGGLEQALSDIL